MNKLEVHIQGDVEPTLDSRNMPQGSRAVQRPPYAGNKPLYETNWTNLSSKSKDMKENASLSPIVVSVTDGTHPARARPFISPRNHGTVFLTDSMKNWEHKLNSSFNSHSSTCVQHKPGSVDPRFRKVVPHRKPQKLDIATDTEDLVPDHEQSSSRGVDDSDCKPTKSLLVAREKPEKLGDIVLPLKKAVSVDCGVQAPELERCIPKLSLKEPKGFRDVRHSASEISLGQSSCDTKKTYSETSFNSNATDEQCFAKAKKKSPREYDVNEHLASRKPSPRKERSAHYPPEKDKEWPSRKFSLDAKESSLCVHVPRTVSKDMQIKCKVPEPAIGKMICNKKSSLKCAYSPKRRTKGSNTNISHKGAKVTRSFCKHCNDTNASEGLKKEEDLFKIVLMLLGAVFVATASFWVLTILIAFLPSFYEWLYPPANENYIFSFFSKVFG
ncbi:hypothetical protein C0J52_10043 [Blattella germanica]|nr:hypothetical protein C0J52_10043 [Blattella germanica]